MNQQNQMGKVRLLGMGRIEGACGPIMSIAQHLLKGCRLIMKTDAGVWYVYNEKIKDTIEKYGCGLLVQEVHEVENEIIEVIIEVLPEISQKEIYVNGIRRLSPANAYILATDFAGEFFVKLYREEPNGTRTFLWGEDWIDK